MTNTTIDLPTHVRDYFEALNELDRQTFLNCFVEDAITRDPYGGPVYEGRSGLEKFFDGVEKTWASFEMAPQAAYRGGDRLAVPWRTLAVAKNGRQAEFSGVNVFTVAGDGRIRELDAYWDFRAMLAQIRD